MSGSRFREVLAQSKTGKPVSYVTPSVYLSFQVSCEDSQARQPSARQGRAANDADDRRRFPAADVLHVHHCRSAQMEGNFNIKMPRRPGFNSSSSMQRPPVRVRLTANADGTLKSIIYQDRPMRDFAALRSQIAAHVGGDTGIRDNAEVEIDADYNLHYRYTVDAITHVSGYIADDGQSTVRLIEKIRFAQPQQRR